jgi:GT2 family glycosyltransferase
MITYNRREEVLRTLEHLTALPEKPRIVVVDNGSTDGTAAAIGRSFEEVEVVPAGRNLGAAGRTLGAQLVSEPYIAFCDDDSWWRPGDLARAADLFDRHPRLAVINGHILVGPEEREDPLCRELADSPLPADPDLPGPCIMGFLAGMSVIRRAAYLEVGGFNPRIFLCGEEEWLAADLASSGWKMCYVRDLVVHHHPSPQRDGHGRRAEGIRNTLWFTWLRRPLVSAVKRTVRLLRTLPRDKVSLRGLAAVTGLPRMLSDYRVVPPEVERCFRLLDEPQLNSRARRYVS